MKKLLSLIAATSILIASCTKSADNPQNSNNDISTVVSKEFIVTKLTDNSTDKSSLFSGYTFIFNADGTISAVKNNVTEQGSYTQKPSHEGEAAKLTITFGNAPLSELNKQWQVNSISGSSIRLSDDGNAGEVLQFAAK
ncbi:MAG TPA: hypothetical protein VFW07_28530 [Parafilimonas sp.]|nr:hypothetical protein [Parafilimonas sp.]